MCLMDLEVALGYGECPVCFDPICSKGASVMTDRAQAMQKDFFSWSQQPNDLKPKRVCRHFLCQECAPTIIPKLCPVCRRDFVAVVNVPDPVANPSQWFDMVDINQVRM
ncbi:unnamed protein product [Choristocarpus tenellus]